MGYNLSGLTFGPKGMIIQESLGILPNNAFLTHPMRQVKTLQMIITLQISPSEAAILGLGAYGPQK